METAIYQKPIKSLIIRIYKYGENKLTTNRHTFVLLDNRVTIAIFVLLDFNGFTLSPVSVLFDDGFVLATKCKQKMHVTSGMFPNREMVFPWKFTLVVWRKSAKMFYFVVCELAAIPFFSIRTYFHLINFQSKIEISSLPYSKKLVCLLVFTSAIECWSLQTTTKICLFQKRVSCLTRGGPTIRERRLLAAVLLEPAIFSLN